MSEQEPSTIRNASDGTTLPQPGDVSAGPAGTLSALSQLQRSAFPAWGPPLFFLLLSLCFLWRSIFTGNVFLPAHLLEHVAPFGAQIAPESLPPWNPLRWDGIAQFYPWRHFAAETMRSGTIPLWNPYQFSGTPFVANSQSAVLYPGNILFYLLPTARAFGFSALLHLTLCGWFTYLLLRQLRCSDFAALLGGVVFTFSAWQVSWLQLPTFLATSCWLPLLIRQILLMAPSTVLHRPMARCAGLGAIVGMMLLAGHLQIAFYGLLAGSLCALSLLATATRTTGFPAVVRSLVFYVVSLAIGLMLTSPQLLPSIELSRMSHRVSTPTAAGYQAYIEYGLPPHSLITLSLPEFFGADSDTDNPYWNFYRKNLPGGAVIGVRHNAAETALFVGFLPLMLGGLALARLARKGNDTTAILTLDRRVLFFAGLALLALLLALGTPVNALFYFGIPGFGQSGSPARSLVLWAFACSVLAALGLDTGIRNRPTAREFGGILLASAFVVAIGLSLAAGALAQAIPGLKTPTLGEALSHLPFSAGRLLLAAAIGIYLLRPQRQTTAIPISEQSPAPARPFHPAGIVTILAVTVELFSVGINCNPTAPTSSVYPETPGIAYLRQHVGHDRIFPVNQRWSLYKSPPAVLPPNGAMVYGIRDVQGYDSLFTGQYKAWANRFARPNRMGLLDASPPEVGNMVFFQNPNSPLVQYTGAAFAVTPSPSSPAFVADAAPSTAPVYNADAEMAIYPLPNARPRAELVTDGSTAVPVTWGKDEPNQIDLGVVAPPDAMLILADQYYPGWRASLDGRSVPISRPPAAPIYRAVTIPPGQHHIAFRYEPMSFRLGVYLACLAITLIAFCLVNQFAGQHLNSNSAAR